MQQGLYFEDFLVGSRYYTDRRTITETDLVNFTTLCGFFEPLFMDRPYVENQSQFKNRIAPGALTFSIAEGLTILSGILHKTGMAFLSVEMQLLRPVFIGDTLSVEIEVMEKRETKKADRGIVTCLHRVVNQEKVAVMEYKIKRMIRRKPHETG
ncbi:MAG: MaoC family dehydratase N-terminal domain-containing protein [Deltaproteobacteria bacterium]|nr:MaoC family dehydratase N-terminal domain-containing protein [Deltaproteobacteria bacterium]MBW1961641.1 MaoC family dehydratase N-terminal domain-containing protein [Deltaproteobacteria bacterium]MBW1995932.1 MaoC family dehydratase N-terminal domain-containing protein [Deltaproteobacteria bacterium]MBW2151334.1 MaoC family dehydratase N-terminal domain-containing protein [Deltaproteobacteria bacterium]